MGTVLLTLAQGILRSRHCNEFSTLLGHVGGLGFRGFRGLGSLGGLGLRGLRFSGFMFKESTAFFQDLCRM